MGDVYFKNNYLFQNLKFFCNKIKKKTIMVPLKSKNNPYVTFVPDKNDRIKMFYSKEEINLWIMLSRSRHILSIII